MELTAQANKKRNNLFFATPLEYDHFGYADIQRNYLEAEDRVFEINPNSTVIRSNLQDGNEAIAYFRSVNKANFSFPLISSSAYVKSVVDALSARTKGERILVETPSSEPINVKIDPSEYEHAK
jgi:hypothetical protein